MAAPNEIWDVGMTHSQPRETIDYEYKSEMEIHKGTPQKVKIEVFSFDENRKIQKKLIEVSPEEAEKILSENTVLGEDPTQGHEKQLQDILDKEHCMIVTKKLKSRLRNLIKKKNRERNR